MRKLKKYLAVAVLLLALPISAFIATKFVLESDKSIYKFIPEESDIVIEINTRNFISEVAYQRIYEESYFHEKIVREEYEEPVADFGLDIFSSIVIFRERWSEKSMWMALVGYTDQGLFKNYISENFPSVKTCFGKDYVMLQLTPYEDQEQVELHMKKIMNGEEKSFNDRVHLSEIFDRRKEINCYIAPSDTQEGNQLLSGNLSLDFLADQIEIAGEFTPVSGFSENAPVAYALDEEAPFSLRSSLNLLNSVHWFSEDNITGLPLYSQMAVDYHGMNLFMVNKELGYMYQFKQHPDLQAHFDIINYPNWKNFFDGMLADPAFKIDTVAHILSTNMGTFFNYRFDEKEFDLLRSEENLTPNEDEKLYFAFQMKILPILENIKLAIDENNPPSKMDEQLGLGMVGIILEELQVMANVESVRFELKLEDETNMVADGKIQMLNKGGHSIIESVSFGSAAILFIAEYLSSAETGL
jgi:hypothetical protein